PSLRSTVAQFLDDAVYIVFDIETTGGNPERNGITELAALKIVNGAIVDRFHSLVNPMIPIPPIVRRMTGITNQLVKDAPVIDEIYPDFAEFIGDHILVSHNTIGDLIFLRHFAKDTIGRDLRNFFLCTHLLVEKLVPESPDKSLKGLGKFLELSGVDFHRAEADAVQTWELFKVLLKRLKERGINRVEHAVRLQGDIDSALRLGWSVAKEKTLDIPQGIGVFYLFDHENKLLFLSSALSIAREVAKLGQHDLIPRQILKLSLRAYDLQFKRMNSLFAAMLSECDDREKYHLQVDPASFHQRQIQVVGICEDRAEGQRLSVGVMEEGIKHGFGPVKDRKRALVFIEDLADLLGEKVTRSGMVISRKNRPLVLHLLSGTLDQFQVKTQREIFGLRLLFWKQEALKLQREMLEKISLLLGLQREIQNQWPPVSELNGVVVVPGSGPEHWQIYPILSGVPALPYNVEVAWEDCLFKDGLGKK
ncbi:MAG: exonuclease domain-containing protein, partial [Proteobacteria bacterium]|nr:exonuclease domain-containing protein [Pseudomonadota bacterium]